MECKAEDYYDIPYELLPTPNFAGRPTSEISDIGGVLDGFWTFPSSESSSSGGDDDSGLTPTAQSPAKSLPLRIHVEQEAAEKLGIKAISPSSNRVQRHTRYWSDLGPTSEIPRPGKKAATAPPGAPCLLDFAAQPPRRALSAGLGRSKTVRRRTTHRQSDVESFLVANGALEGMKSEPQKPLPQPPHTSECETTAQMWSTLQPLSSISEKDRVRKALRRKKLTMLDTSFVDFQARRYFESPISMTNTPRELYGVSAPGFPGIPPCPRSSGSLSIQSLPQTSLHPKQPDTLHPETLQCNDDVVGAYTGEQSRLYLPGPVVLEKHSMLLRKDSVATMDVFDSGPEPKAKRFSDLMTADGIVTFFADLGVIDETSDDSLDKYWVDEESKQRSSAWSKCTSIVSIMEPVLRSPLSPPSPPSPRSAQSGCEMTGLTRIPSRFSFSSASSSASLPRAGTPIGKRLKWIRLLTPGIPGSAFLKSAGS
ncbi:hypothetical protein P153DRAFT_363890 [Dothidotthia symphoricarpi CBS 119687]|uniref:Uncharacterized protein n=1 Tax=Dothidotthia symphoricarpi CBS 119687 TaxID=1392245 RepID=A0A6A6AN69_9PLEO|nr:uncharacterized protein P153DRAFT_363890 [Dothidotthia symphoricarpi CBS 119687]KAF2132588.1 hypothetical protein P153DRAFT_363890 [Dothidotthia symphoricarpi CBS 119687]